MRMRPLLSGRSHPSTGPGTGHSRGAGSWAPEACLSQSVGGLCWVQPARAAPVRTLARCLSPWGPGHLLKGAAAPALHSAACMRRLVWSARLSQKPGNLLPPPAALPCAECGQGPELGLGAGSAGPPHRTGFTKAFRGSSLREVRRSPLPHWSLTSLQSGGFRMCPGRVCWSICRIETWVFTFSRDKGDEFFKRDEMAARSPKFVLFAITRLVTNS